MSDTLLRNMSKSSEVQHNELPSIKFLRSQPQRGGNSPFPNPNLHHKTQASTAWERCAKTRFSIMSSIHARASESMVTLMRGLFSFMFISHPISQDNLKYDKLTSYLISSNEIEVVKNEKYEQDSGRYTPGRAGGKGIILPNYRGRGNNTHSRKSVIRVLSNGGYGYLRQVGETNLSLGHGSKKDNSVCPDRVMNVDKCGKIRQKNGNSGDTVPGKLLRISFRNVDYSSGFNRLESRVDAISQRDARAHAHAHTFEKMSVIHR